MELKNSIECVEKLSEREQVLIPENQHLENLTGLSACNYLYTIAGSVHEPAPCGKFYKPKSNLTQHWKRKGRVLESTVSDETCGSAVAGSSRIQKREKFKCEVCGALFSRKSGLQQHALRAHSSGIKSYECDKCQKRFILKGDLNAHRRLRTAEKQYHCDVCMKSFYQKSDLMKHERIHTRDKPYQCDICMKRFSRQDALNIHKRVHTEEKPYQCEICMKRFNVVHNLKRHERVHTGEKPYECDICRRKFSQQINLNIHKRFHTGEKPYQCDICMRKFCRQNSFKNHARVHLQKNRSIKKGTVVNLVSKCYEHKAEG